MTTVTWTMAVDVIVALLHLPGLVSPATPTIRYSDPKPGQDPPVGFG